MVIELVPNLGGMMLDYNSIAAPGLKKLLVRLSPEDVTIERWDKESVKAEFVPAPTLGRWAFDSHKSPDLLTLWPDMPAAELAGTKMTIYVHDTVEVTCEARKR